MKLLNIDNKNIDQEHICCAIGNDEANTRRAEGKKTWMKQRFKDGLVFKRFDARGKFFIEYLPIENVWKPIKGRNYLAINCLWVSGQYKNKGLAKKLLNECIQDAKKQKKDGVCYVASNKKMPFLTDKKFFEHFGFKVVDQAQPYFELLAYKINKNSPNPQFAPSVKKGKISTKKDFSFIYSDQCPYMEEYVSIMANVLIKKKISHELIKLTNKTEAQKLGSPFGTLVRVNK
jgi:ribosomal protein S18 acetylase RimI-like enzyme